MLRISAIVSLLASGAALPVLPSERDTSSPEHGLFNLTLKSTGLGNEHDRGALRTSEEIAAWRAAHPEHSEHHEHLEHHEHPEHTAEEIAAWRAAHPERSEHHEHPEHHEHSEK